MKWLQLLIVALDKLPVDRMFVRHTDDKSLERLEKILTQAPAIIPNKTLEKKELTDNSIPGVQSNKGSGNVSYDELVLYQRKEIGKQLLLLQMHLEQKCKIGGKACDCCEKHPIAIEALSQETLGITGDSLYSELAGWAQAMMPVTTAEASASGKYDDKYPDMAIKARDYRKRVMGSTRVQDLLNKEQAVKVEKQMQDILKSYSEKGGDHGGE